MQTAREFRLTPEQIAAGKNVFLMMALVDMMRPIVEGYQQKILNELGYPELTPCTAYQLPNGVDTTYYARCNEERIKAGLKVENQEHCPLLVAEDMLRVARNTLIEAFEPVTGLTTHALCCAGMDKYHEYIDLTLRLVASNPH